MDWIKVKNEIFIIFPVNKLISKHGLTILEMLFWVGVCDPGVE